MPHPKGIFQVQAVRWVDRWRTRLVEGCGNWIADPSGNGSGGQTSSGAVRFAGKGKLSKAEASSTNESAASAAAGMREQIILCQNKGLSPDLFHDTLMHELVHAYDVCTAKFDFNDCVTHACSEVGVGFPKSYSFSMLRTRMSLASQKLCPRFLAMFCLELVADPKFSSLRATCVGSRFCTQWRVRYADGDEERQLHHSQFAQGLRASQSHPLRFAQPSLRCKWRACLFFEPPMQLVASSLLFVLTALTTLAVVCIVSFLCRNARKKL